MGTQDHIYTLQISLAGCRYDVRVNDVPIFRDIDEGFPLNATMAVNEYLLAGSNNIAVTLKPRPDHQTLEQPAETFFAMLMGRPAGRPKTDDRPLVTLHLKPGGNPSERITLEGDGRGLLTIGGAPRSGGDGATTLSAGLAFTLTGPSFPWAWQGSEHIADGAETRDSLRRLIASWSERLEKRDVRWLGAVLGERNAELSRALFEPPAVLADHGLYEAVADSSLTFIDPDLAHAQLLVCGERRLARLLRWDGTPVLAFLEAGGESARYYPFTFRKDGNRWIICR